MTEAEPTRESIVIDAPPDRIMGVIAAFERYPDWVSAAREVTVVARAADGQPQRVEFVVEEGFLRDTYQLEYHWAAGGRSVEWELVKSTLQRTQQGRYDLVPAGDGATTVTYTLEVTVQIPMLGMLRRKAEKTITDTALKELKRYVESGRAAQD